MNAESYAQIRTLVKDLQRTNREALAAATSLKASTKIHALGRHESMLWLTDQLVEQNYLFLEIEKVLDASAVTEPFRKATA